MQYAYGQKSDDEINVKFRNDNFSKVILSVGENCLVLLIHFCFPPQLIVDFYGILISRTTFQMFRENHWNPNLMSVIHL